MTTHSATIENYKWRGLTTGLQNCSLCNISTVTWLWWLARDYNISASSDCHVQLSLPVFQKKSQWGSWQERSHIVSIYFSPEEQFLTTELLGHQCSSAALTGSPTLPNACLQPLLVCLHSPVPAHGPHQHIHNFHQAFHTPCTLFLLLI